MLLSFGITLALMMSQGCYGYENNVVHEKWKIGDTWSVRTWYAEAMLTSEKNYVIRKGKPVKVDFKVSSIKSLDDFKVPYKPSKISERVEYNVLVHPELDTLPFRLSDTICLRQRVF